MLNPLPRYLSHASCMSRALHSKVITHCIVTEPVRTYEHLFYCNRTDWGPDMSVVRTYLVKGFNKLHPWPVRVCVLGGSNLHLMC